MKCRSACHPLIRSSRLLLFLLAALALWSASEQPLHASPLPPLAPHAAMGPAAPSQPLQFTSHGQVLSFQPGEFYISNGTYALQVQFVDARPVAPIGDSRSTGSELSAPPSTAVTYANLWDGITLTYDSSRGGVVTSSYRLEPLAGVDAIHLSYNAPVTLNADGTLTIAYATGQIRESAPLAWQDVAGVRVPVRVAFESRGEREVGFAVGEYDATHPLFIDPTLTWNTFLGASGPDYGLAIALDGNGNVYVAGQSNASWGSPVRPHASGADAFVAKLSANGALLWNTFLGASADDSASAIASDASGNVYVAGYSSATWQGANPPLRGYTGGRDAFAVKLSSTGELAWNTFLGASGNDAGLDLAVDANGGVYVAGYSDATWQGTNPPVRAFGGGFNDAFAAKLSSSGELTWNTFLGGSGNDSGSGIAVDGSGNVYVAGGSDAAWQDTNPPVRDYRQSVDAFAAKLSSTGELIWNTFLGGNSFDFVSALAVDGNGYVFVVGTSQATWESPVRDYTGGINDAFAVKLGSDGALLWNTFLGGGGEDFGFALTVDGNGFVYVVGDSNTSWGLPAHQYTGDFDVYAAKLNSSGELTWNTFVGGSGGDGGHAIALDENRNIYAVGYSNVTWGSPVRPHSGGGTYDVFVAQLGAFDLALPLIVK